ncbi:MAG: DUF4350 domain-containing protein, partial [Acidobacteriota bacterium]
MRQRLFIIITLVVVVVVLIALNAASYVKIEKTGDSEGSPDRSTFNSGATGTRALYDFLRESGYPVARWRESTAALLNFSGPKPATIVIVGRTIVPFSKSENQELLRWVARGGRLVVIDRNPNPNWLPASGVWNIATRVSSYPWADVAPNDFEQMTSGVKAVSASQPTLLAQNVEAILPSRFAAAITVAADETRKTGSQTNGADQDANSEESSDDSESAAGQSSDDSNTTAIKHDLKTVSPAPVVNFMTERGGLLVDYPHGQGRIVLLADPFIVANNGISRADNLQLAINVVNGPGGLVAFDEFHQGRAATHNALIQYFEGTPILALCGQFALIGLAIVWSRGRRFARPLPLPHVDRRSSLEFVASMA